MALPDDPSAFRAAWGRLVGVLTRSARLADPSLAEDAVQHAMVQALRLWPMSGTPDEPVAWLTTVARNHLRDALRARASETPWSFADGDEPAVPEFAQASAHEITDDELALIFACCHPELPAASQVALALKVACGFSLREIASGLLTDEAALAQRLARSRKILASLGAPIALPSGLDLPPRREAAMNAIHLLFNEGYSADNGDDAQRPDLCREAIRLARALAAHPVAGHPDAHALAALLLFQGAWLGTRVDAQGDWRLLDEQDRSRWDGSMIAAALAHLGRAQEAERMSAWHLRAGIAAEHVTSPSFAATRWDVIVAMYEALLAMDDAPSVRLAHAVALAHAEGAQAALPRVEALLDELPPALAAYGHAARAELLMRSARRSEAIDAIDRAIDAARGPAARRLLARKRERMA
ncbi:MAG: DUF6596 domain-containing protein [Burkholderiales bacterium]